MLHLLQPPEWRADGAAPRPLPGTLPMCSVVYLASQALRLAERLAGDCADAPVDARAAARREPRCD